MPTVLLTGANRGLGLEFTRQYLDDGWTVLACARDPAASTLDSLRAGAGARLETHQLDVTDLAAADALAARLEGRAIDVLINCAGTMGSRSFASEGLAVDSFDGADFADWDNVFHINVHAPMKLAKAFAPHVARSEQRRIVNITSVLGSVEKNTIGGLYSYRASKAAVNAISKSMSIDLGRRGIVVIPLHPGWVRTDMGGAKADIDAPESVSGMRKVIAGLTPERAGRYWMYDGTELPW